MADRDAEIFDYIVIGGGSAGCVLANRLSADPAIRVCLIEAGPSDRSAKMRLLTTVPAGLVPLLISRKTNWHHVFTGGGKAGDRTMVCPRGRVLGGSSAVNGMVYSRGQPADYDGWAQLGNTGWSFDDVLPFFRKHEDFAGGADRWHGTGGELHVSRLTDPHPLTRAFIAAAHEAGYPLCGDFNAADAEGFGVHHLTQKHGVRMSSARAFLDPVRARRNLTILTDTTVHRIVLDGPRATGVEIAQGGETRILTARHEIVLSAGAVNSPQLLLLSGIGDAEHLNDVGIAAKIPLPGVGHNLQDHPSGLYLGRDRSRTSVALTWSGLPRLAFTPFDYILRRRGLMSGSVINGGGFVRTRPDVATPDLKIDFMPLARPFGKYLPRMHGYNIFAWPLRPASRGRVLLASADPDARPVMDAAFFRDRVDIDTMTEGFRIIRRIVSQPAFGRYFGGEVLPGEGVSAEEELRDYVVENAGTIYHPAGTCRMGPAGDTMAVVDARLRVHGVEGLRVADTSIMPTLVSGNTNAPAMMIGERAAAFMLADRG